MATARTGRALVLLDQHEHFAHEGQRVDLDDVRVVYRFFAELLQLRISLGGGSEVRDFLRFHWRTCPRKHRSRAVDNPDTIFFGANWDKVSTHRFTSLLALSDGFIHGRRCANRGCCLTLPLHSLANHPCFLFWDCARASL